MSILHSMSICLECNLKFTPKRGSAGKFCNRSCSATHNNRLYPKRIKVEKPISKSKVELWLSGEWDGSTNSGELSNWVRNYLLTQANYRCTRCGWSEISPHVKHGKPVLTIDHIDGRADNNTVDNLVVLCYNCHTLTPTFGSLNKGNGTRYTPGRMERYGRIA